MNKLEMLTDSYRELLQERELKDNARIESVRELALLLKCAPGTAAKVLKKLSSEGMICSVPGKGNFFQKSRRKKFKIGYACPIPPPLFDPLLNDASEALLDFLDTAPGVEGLVIQHRTLRDEAAAAKTLGQLDGMILHSSFLDPVTSKTLRHFSKPAVVIGSVGDEERILCSQIIPDFSTALAEFCRKVDINRYKKIVLLQSGNKNSENTRKQITRFFALSDISVPVKTVQLPPGGNVVSVLYGYDFMASLSPEKDQETLFIALSGYTARGMYEYSLKGGFLPDILSIDNLEGHGDSEMTELFFTAVDRSMTRCFVEGAKLLLRQLESGSDCRSILKVPTELVVRRSIRCLT